MSQRTGQVWTVCAVSVAAVGIAVAALLTWQLHADPPRGVELGGGAERPETSQLLFDELRIAETGLAAAGGAGGECRGEGA